MFGSINEAGERSTFRARYQKSSETVDAYVASLRELAATCNFGSFEDEAIRDQLQEHTFNDRVREKLVSKTHVLTDAMRIAREIESGAHTAREMRNRTVHASTNGDSDSPVHLTRQCF